MRGWQAKRFDKHCLDDPEPEPEGGVKKGPTKEPETKKVPEDAEWIKVIMDAFE